MKKTISFLMASVMLISMLTVSPAYAMEANCVVNEVFDDYAFNAQTFSENIKVVSGLNTRAVERKGTDKALYSEMYGNAVKITVPLAKLYDKTVFTYDIRIDGKVEGNILDLKSGNPVFRYLSGGGISLDTDKKIGGYTSGKWDTYAVAVNFKSGTYDLYVNGKMLFADRYFYSTPKTVKEFSFVFSPLNEDEKSCVYLDNIRVYEGETVLPASSFETKVRETAVENFTEKTDKVTYDKIFLDSNGRDGISPSFTQKEDTIARWESVPGENRDSMHFVKEGKNDVYADISTGLPEDCTKFVIECDVYPGIRENTTANICTMYGYDGLNSQIMKIYQGGGRFIIGGDETFSGELPIGKWSHVSVVVNLISGTCDGYVNGVLKATGATLQNGGCVPSKIRVGFPGTSATGYNEVYYRNYKIYEGDKLREFDDEDTPAVEITDEVQFTSILESNERVKSFLQYDTVFATSNSKCYINKEKKDYSAFSAEPFTNEDGVLFVPSDIMATAFSLNEAKGDASLTLGKYTFANGSNECKTATGTVKLDADAVLKDGIWYIPAESFCRDALGKYVYTDERGYMLVSDEERNYKNNSSNIWEISDSIHKYIHFDRPDGNEIYDAVKSSEVFGKHPRMLATKEEFQKLSARFQTDKELLDIYKSFLVSCEASITQPLSKYDKPDGLRLYGAIVTSATLINRLGTAYQLTGDAKYAERAWQEIENILSWNDWNCDAHYLDTGEAVPFIAVGYDCIYEYLTPDRRALFTKRFQELYLDYAVGACMGTSKFTLHDSRNTASNWGAVCGSGMLHAAFLLIDEEDENSLLTKKCKFLASQVIQSLEFPLGQIFPNGTTTEGFVYWDYYLTSLSRATDLLVRMCSDDYSLLSAPGFDKSVDYGLYGQTAIGAWPYSETAMDLGVYFPMSMFLYSKLTGDDEKIQVLEAVKNELNIAGSVNYLLWNGGNLKDTKINYPLDYYAPGDEISVMKSSWTDKNAIYLGALGGTTSITKSHFDKGTFLFEALGERWFIDLGKDNYDINDNGTYWHEELRNRLYRLRTEGHNCLVINPTPDNFGQEADVAAKVIRHESSDRGSISVYDLTDIYGDRTNGYIRGFYMCDDRDAVMIQDEVSLNAGSELYWFAHTKANAELLPDRKSVILKQNGKEIKVEFYTNLDNWTLDVVDAEPLSEKTKAEGEYSREGIRKLQLKSSNVSGNVTICAKITPVDENIIQMPIDWKPVSEWKIPEGSISKPELSVIKMNGTQIADFNPATKKYVINLPYGSAVPVFEAYSDNCKVQITQPQSLMDECIIHVTNDEGRTAIYRVSFELEIVVANKLSNALPEAGLPSGAKLIKASSVRASDEPQKDHTAPCATDGDFSTSWTSDKDGEFIELDLGSVADFDGVALSFLYGNTRTYKFEILYSEDKQNYTRVFNGDSSGKTAENEILKIPGKARYIRLVGHFNSESNWNNLAEFHAYKEN